MASQRRMTEHRGMSHMSAMVRNTGLRISLNRPPNLDVSDFQLFPISGFLDMRKTFPGTFQDFNFDMLKSRHVCKNVRNVDSKCTGLHIIYIYIYIYLYMPDTNPSPLPAHCVSAF